MWLQYFEMENKFCNRLCLAYSLSSLGVRLLGMTSSKQNGILQEESRVKKFEMEINWQNASCLWRILWCHIWWWGRFFNWHVVVVAMVRYVLSVRKMGTLGYILILTSAHGITRDLYKGTCKSTKKPSDRPFVYMS